MTKTKRVKHKEGLRVFLPSSRVRELRVAHDGSAGEVVRGHHHDGLGLRVKLCRTRVRASWQ